MDNYNQPIINKLEEYSKNEKNFFKKKVYINAINNLRGINILSMNDINNIKGIGKSIKLKIQDVLNNSKPIMMSDDLTVIYGIGNATIKKLNKNNIYNIEQLKLNDNLLNDKQKIGLFYFNDINKKIPYDEISLHDKYIKNVLNNINGINCYSIVGSYRRKSEYSSDIDVLVNTDKNILEEIILKMRNNGYIIEILACKNIKFMGIVKLKNSSIFRRMDIMVTSSYEFPFAQLYFTGSKEHNIMMRNKAKKMGYKLNEHKIIDINNNNKIFNIKTEKDIFEFLDIKYIEPYLRK